MMKYVNRKSNFLPRPVLNKIHPCAFIRDRQRRPILLEALEFWNADAVPVYCSQHESLDSCLLILLYFNKFGSLFIE